MSDNYGTHMPILERLFDVFTINTVLEFGCGLNSTPLFVERAKEVVSIEQQDESWLERVREAVDDSDKWTGVYEPGRVPVLADTPDLVLSDGHATTRCEVANSAMHKGVQFVVCHDVEQTWYYKWYMLDIPENYLRFNWLHDSGKVTTLLTPYKKAGWYDIPDHKRVSIAYDSPQQSVKYVILQAA